MAKTLSWNKPHITILGKETEAIQAHVKGPDGVIEAPFWYINPAYDLDG